MKPGDKVKLNFKESFAYFIKKEDIGIVKKVDDEYAWVRFPNGHFCVRKSELLVRRVRNATKV